MVGFFFQAEDGIRDTSVTGVQTCALPISQFHGGRREFRARALAYEFRIGGVALMAIGIRSEERRVGKEWRSGGETEQLTKKSRAQPAQITLVTTTPTRDPTTAIDYIYLLA